MIAAALGVHPDDGILRAVLLGLLFCPEGHQDLRRVPAGCAEERKNNREKPRTKAMRGNRCGVRLVVGISVTAIPNLSCYG